MPDEKKKTWAFLNKMLFDVKRKKKGISKLRTRKLDPQRHYWYF